LGIGGESINDNSCNKSLISSDVALLLFSNLILLLLFFKSSESVFLESLLYLEKSEFKLNDLFLYFGKVSCSNSNSFNNDSISSSTWNTLKKFVENFLILKH